MQFFSTILNLAVAASFSSAMPVSSADSDATAATAQVDWYQGVATFSGTSAVISADGSCGTKVSSGTITAGGCQKLSTYAFGLHHNPDQACSYRLWKGVTDCSGTDYTDIPIPADSDVTCVNDGVLDGGRWYLASGIYTCE
ncbi:hypothetical protein N8I77_003197 [Diaporthe amygdali]|uniref:Uncharacterized protein n=1 Tax=Phomopsis amygdali TaxID=1214568 RepID=A0AAD9SIR7_PHOAM|nr:hypothetical protein N8I77_003197 [Diaporthe amygdali]